MKGENIMNLLNLLITDVIPRIKQHDRSSLIGEGTQAEVYDKFTSEEHQHVCFKVFYPKGEYAVDEYTILKHLYDKRLAVPKPLELFEEANAYAMEKIHGHNLEEIISNGLKLSEDVIEAMTDELKDICAVVHHNDLSTRNVMFGDITIEDNVIVDAAPYVIDFGHSSIHKTTVKSEEYMNVVRAMHRIKA